MRHLSHFILILIFITSCVSSDRAFKVMPYGSGKKMAPDRINLFPIFYSNADEVSVLWPFYDHDENGFALRPLIHNDKDNWSVLFPLSAWNTKDKSGWALNTYWNKKKQGFFPLYHWNLVDDQGWLLNYYQYHGNRGIFPIANWGKTINYVGPFWWDKDKDNNFTQTGLFPVMSFGEFNNIGPAYWWKDNSRMGLFPIAHWNSENNDGWVFPYIKKGANNFVFPIAYWNNQKEERIFPPYYKIKNMEGIFPIAAWGDSFNYAGPVYWYNNDDGSKTAGLFPLYTNKSSENLSEHKLLLGLAGYRKEPQSTVSWTLPLWYHKNTPDHKRDWVLPLFYHDQTKDNNRWVTPLSFYEKKDDSSQLFTPLFYKETSKESNRIITPLGGYGWSDNDKYKMTNILGPIFHYSSDEKSTLKSVLWPVYVGKENKETKTKSTSILWPMYSHETVEDKSDTRYFMGGIYYNKDDVENKTHDRSYFWNAFRNKTIEDKYELNYYGPFYYHEKDLTKKTETTSVMWPVYNNKKVEDKSDNTYWFGRLAFQENDLENNGRTTSVLGPMYYDEFVEGKSRKINYGPFLYQYENFELNTKDRLILGPLWIDRYHEGNLDMTAALGGLLYYHDNDFKTKTETTAVLGAVYFDKKIEDKDHLRLLGPLYYNHKNLVKKTESTNFLWPLYVNRKDYNIDKERTSLLGPFLQYETQKEKSNWHVWPLYTHQEDNSFYAATSLLSYTNHVDSVDSIKDVTIGTKFLFSYNRYASKSYESKTIDFLTFFNLRSRNDLNKIDSYKHFRAFNQNNNKVDIKNRVSTGYYHNGFFFDWFKTSGRNHTTFKTELESSDFMAYKKPRNVHSQTNKVLKIDKVKARQILNKHKIVINEGEDVSVTYDNFIDSKITQTEDVDTHTRIPFIFEYESNDEDYEWDFLCWAVWGEKHGEIEETRVLYALYHSQYDGTTKSVECFPWITYDTSEDYSKFTFAWRLFARTKEKEHTHGYFLFIPYSFGGETE